MCCRTQHLSPRLCSQQKTRWSFVASVSHGQNFWQHAPSSPNACLRKKCGTCYTVRPSLIVQSKQQASTTCKFLTWELACASSTSSQHMLPANDRGFQKINKRKLADIRQRGARRGGKVRAGNGTTADQSAAKKRRIIKWARKHGFPSRRVAQQKFGLSSVPWKALKMMAWKTWNITIVYRQTIWMSFFGRPLRWKLIHLAETCRVAKTSCLVPCPVLMFATNATI